MFLVINKDKVCAYIVAIFTVAVLFGIANTYNIENEFMKVNAKTTNSIENIISNEIDFNKMVKK